MANRGGVQPGAGRPAIPAEKVKQTVSICLEKETIRKIDKIARDNHLSRSAIVRDAILRHLRL